jgi:hypothetical protein
MRQAVLGAAAVALCAIVPAAAGCGSGDEQTESVSAAAARRAEMTRGGRSHRGSPANPAPKNSSPFVRELYRQFPPPRPEPGVKGAAAAIRAGERACAGKTPTEVKESFYPIAVAKGRLDPETPEGRMISAIAKYEARVTREPSFTAGQLAAAAYQRALAPKLASSGYQGCIYALAVELERRLSRPQ